MDERTRREYHRFRKSGMSPSNALDAARTEIVWDALEEAGYVKLTAELDETHDWTDEEPAIVAKYGSDGAWGSCGWYTLYPVDAERVEPSFKRGNPWNRGDSVWGHIGYRDVLDPAENWYVADVKAGTIRELQAAAEDAPRQLRERAHEAKAASEQIRDILGQLAPTA